MTPDPQIQTEIESSIEQLAPSSEPVSASSTVVIPRADACGNSAGAQLCESLGGDVVADAMREHASGADFAITNSGGLRADLTCPALDVSDRLLPGAAAPVLPDHAGSVLGVLPFGNLVATVDVTAPSSRGCSRTACHRCRPSPVGSRRSRACASSTTSRSQRTPESRRSSIKSPTGAVTSSVERRSILAPSTAYTVAENDFMVDGWRRVSELLFRGARRLRSASWMSRPTNYISANTPVTPTIQGRVSCIDPNRRGHRLQSP